MKPCDPKDCDAKDCVPKDCVDPRHRDPGGEPAATPPTPEEEGELERHVEAVVARATRPESPLAHVDAVAIPSREVVIGLVTSFLEIVYPGFFGRTDLTRGSLPYHIGDAVHGFHQRLAAQVARCFRHACLRDGATTCEDCTGNGRRVATAVIGEVPKIQDLIESDVEAAFNRDPALRSADEAIIATPGILAISVHRLAHELWACGVPLIPRILSEHAHSVTGVDIHPGATIGRAFFIDHGTGVVIGETTEIGERVTLYQGVTLGALRIPRDQEGRAVRGAKRHPTLEDDVTVYGGATILGPVHIGARSTIGGNVWLTTDVPADTRVMIDTPHLVMKTNTRGA